MGKPFGAEVADFTLSRKASIEFKGARTVKPTQVGEESILRPARETIVKELGKMTP